MNLYTNWRTTLYQQIYPTVTSLGSLYGAPKVHKPKCPFRPVLTAYRMHNFHLAKYLAQIIKYSFSSSFTASNSYNFITQLHSVSPHNSIYSLDNQSLLTHTPLQQTIDLLTNHIFQHCSHFLHFISLAASDTFSIYNDSTFK